MFHSLVRFFQMGGFFMFPILIVLAVGLAIAVERWIHLKRVKDENKKTWDSDASGAGQGRVRQGPGNGQQGQVDYGADAGDGT